MTTIHHEIIECFLFALGAAVGSFLNVCVHRLPARLSLFHPPSRCPGCKSQIACRDNVPILGWLALRGRCRWCRMPIAARYPAVELFTGLFFAAVYWLQIARPAIDVLDGGLLGHATLMAATQLLGCVLLTIGLIRFEASSPPTKIGPAAIPLDDRGAAAPLETTQAS
jgi:prepilin signal peptidase PulO-like enzyme (type II secretory pathway)